MYLLELPIELLLEITALALEDNRRPSDFLLINKLFHTLGQPILHARLRFRSIEQLTLFTKHTAHLACLPRSISVTLAGGLADFDVFRHLAAALLRCRSAVPGKNFVERGAQLPLESLSFCLHSHSRNPDLHDIYEALAQASPKEFIWTGPDPEHHFSTAIVPSATYHLFCAIRTWTAIEHITLTNLMFPSDELGIHGPLAANTPLLPVIPSLRTLSLGQVTLLPPSAIAAMICLPGQDNLELIRLIDAYRLSIWGPRIRRSDIEKAVVAILEETDDKRDREVLLDQVRKLVRCEAKTERIMGGDRVEGLTTLD